MTLLQQLLESSQLSSDLKSFKLKRYKNKVGKDIGGFTYFHKQYINQFPDVEDNILQKSLLLPNDFKYNTIKYNRKNGEVSFINSPDFDTSDEPISKDSYTVKGDGTLKYYNPKTPAIWHHKWLWVMDDYKGFDVDESKKRSVFWNKELENHPDKRIRSRIGSKKIWDELEFNKGK